MLPTPLESEPGTLAPSFPNYTETLKLTKVFSHWLNPDNSQMSIPSMGLAPKIHIHVIPASGHPLRGPSLGAHSA